MPRRHGSALKLCLLLEITGEDMQGAYGVITPPLPVPDLQSIQTQKRDSKQQRLSHVRSRKCTQQTKPWGVCLVSEFLLSGSDEMQGGPRGLASSDAGVRL